MAIEEGAGVDTGAGTGTGTGAGMARGVNLIGYARYEMGIGESCRLAARALEACDIPFAILNFAGGNMSRSEDRSWAHRETNKPEYAVNLFHINADQMPVAYAELGEQWFAGRVNIGYWHWELPEFPALYAEGFRHLNEVWVPTEFIRRSVADKSPVPVATIPHGVREPEPVLAERARFGLPERKFLFLCMYDTYSYSARKNPQAVLAAYRAAVVRYGIPAGLVIKMNNPQRAEIDNLKREAAGLPHVRIIDRVMSRDDVQQLMRCCDCYVSLHRSEGFGLPLAEAMIMGKPVIGTNWSGNTDFMTPDNSGAVRHRLVRVGQDFGPYKAHQLWAEPDIEHAAHLMKRVVYDDEWRTAIARRGRETIRESFSPEASGRAMRERLEKLWNV
ncbi:glycosyltransferase family 4 protein [Cohnella soli]|uniref:Glycosyltransferase family 4 protein n=1 Tax=Cohnella soli TaxID=425005 RepID=A0ABW0HMA7_9BACL